MSLLPCLTLAVVPPTLNAVTEGMDCDDTGCEVKEMTREVELPLISGSSIDIVFKSLAGLKETTLKVWINNSYTSDGLDFDKAVLDANLGHQIGPDQLVNPTEDSDISFSKLSIDKMMMPLSTPVKGMQNLPVATDSKTLNEAEKDLCGQLLSGGTMYQQYAMTPSLTQGTLAFNQVGDSKLYLDVCSDRTKGCVPVTISPGQDEAIVDFEGVVVSLTGLQRPRQIPKNQHIVRYNRNADTKITLSGWKITNVPETPTKSSLYEFMSSCIPSSVNRCPIQGIQLHELFDWKLTQKKSKAPNPAVGILPGAGLGNEYKMLGAPDAPKGARHCIRVGAGWVCSGRLNGVMGFWRWFTVAAGIIASIVFVVVTGGTAAGLIGAAAGLAVRSAIVAGAAAMSAGIVVGGIAIDDGRIDCTARSEYRSPAYYVDRYNGISGRSSFNNSVKMMMPTHVETDANDNVLGGYEIKIPNYEDQIARLKVRATNLRFDFADDGILSDLKLGNCEITHGLSTSWCEMEYSYMGPTVDAKIESMSSMMVLKSTHYHLVAGDVKDRIVFATPERIGARPEICLEAHGVRLCAVASSVHETSTPDRDKHDDPSTDEVVKKGRPGYFFGWWDQLWRNIWAGITMIVLLVIGAISLLLMIGLLWDRFWRARSVGRGWIRSIVFALLIVQARPQMPSEIFNDVVDGNPTRIFMMPMTGECKWQELYHRALLELGASDNDILFFTGNVPITDLTPHVPFSINAYQMGTEGISEPIGNNVISHKMTMAADAKYKFPLNFTAVDVGSYLIGVDGLHKGPELYGMNYCSTGTEFTWTRGNGYIIAQEVADWTYIIGIKEGRMFKRSFHVSEKNAMEISAPVNVAYDTAATAPFFWIVYSLAKINATELEVELTELYQLTGKVTVQGADNTMLAQSWGAGERMKVGDRTYTTLAKEPAPYYSACWGDDGRLYGAVLGGEVPFICHQFGPDALCYRRKWVAVMRGVTIPERDPRLGGRTDVLKVLCYLENDGHIEEEDGSLKVRDGTVMYSKDEWASAGILRSGSNISTGHYGVLSVSTLRGVEMFVSQTKAVDDSYESVWNHLLDDYPALTYTVIILATFFFLFVALAMLSKCCASQAWKATSVPKSVMQAGGKVSQWVYPRTKDELRDAENQEVRRKLKSM